MANSIMPNDISSMKFSLKSVPGLADVGFLMGIGMAPELWPDQKFTFTTLISMKN